VNMNLIFNKTDKVKNFIFYILQLAISPVWKKLLLMGRRELLEEQIASRIAVFIMHKNVGNIARNQNYENLKQFVINEKYQLLGFEATYFSSIDEGASYIGDKFDLRVIQKTFTSPSGQIIKFPYAPGALGIYATLLDAIQIVLTTDRDYLIVFEDDLKIEKNFRIVLNFILSRAPKNWEVLNLLSDPGAHKPIKRVISQIYKPLVKNYSTSISACYVLNKYSAGLILKDLSSNGIRANLDWYLFNGCFLEISNQPIFNTLQLNPFFPKSSSLIPDFRNSTILTK